MNVWWNCFVILLRCVHFDKLTICYCWDTCPFQKSFISRHPHSAEELNNCNVNVWFFSRENITFEKRSIGRFVERHLLIEWCLKPSKRYISLIKTLNSLVQKCHGSIFLGIGHFWNRPTDPMRFSFKHMFDHQGFEQWIVLSASSKYIAQLFYQLPIYQNQIDPYLWEKMPELRPC